MSFETDRYPGKPKILVIGQGFSIHVMDWINTLEGAPYNVRMFALPHTTPPDHWKQKAYVTGRSFSSSVVESDYRKRLFPTIPSKTDPSWLPKWWKQRTLLRQTDSPGQWLADIIDTWQPDIVQTVALNPAALYFLEVKEKYNVKNYGKWCASILGSPDIETEKNHPDYKDRYKRIFQQVDYVVGDSYNCLASAKEVGMTDAQLAPHPNIPADGGVDVDARVNKWKDTNPPSKRRMLLWSKAYDGYFVSSQSVFEALKLAWDEIQPCELVVPGLRQESSRWYWSLPQKILSKSRVPGLMPHDEFVEMVMQARVMLSPSLLEGLPNALVDAMSCGTFPIVSPLPDLKEILEQETNTLFARNLYPEEIAQALIRAMNDDTLVDAAAHANVEVVRRIAQKDEVRQKAIENVEAALAK